MREGRLLTGVPGLVVRAGLSYAAWTQIIPAVLMWMFAFMVLVALGLISMDARGENPATFMQAFAERFPDFSKSLGAWYEARVAPSIEAATDPETGAVHFDRIDFWGAASYIWFWLSLAGTLLGFVWRMIFGPRPRRSLRQKLLLTLGACTTIAVLFFIVMITLPPSFDGTIAQWLTTAASAGLVMLAVTSWSVFWAHGFGRLSETLTAEEVVPT